MDEHQVAFGGEHGLTVCTCGQKFDSLELWTAHAEGENEAWLESLAG